MNESCTCGAALAPGSLFCHKCGRPQRDLPVVEMEAPPVAAPGPPPLRADAPPVNFHNRVAIKIALVMAVVATMLSFLPYVNWLAAGFFTVLIYHRRTGYLLSLESGVRLGWMTGILMFVMMMILFAATLGFITAAGGIAALPAEMRSALDPRVQEMFKMLQSGSAVAQLLVMLFVFTTLLSMAGGALGARLSSRGR